MLCRFVSGFVATTTQKQSMRLAARNLAGIRFHSTSQGGSSDLQVECKDQLLFVRLNRPKRFNSITQDMYLKLTETFQKANHDKSLRAIVLSGTGDYYSSGNDLSNFAAAMKHPKGPRAGLEECGRILFEFVESLINLEKFIVAAVNGPAIGIPVTTLPLCDYVIASDKATFHTPFTALGQCPEACSSVTFPSTMGRAKASELLLLNMTWDAHKAKSCGLVSEVVEHDKFSEHVEKFAKKVISSCYPNAMLVSKAMVQNPEVRKRLSETNRRECDAIVNLWEGEECMDAVQKFFQRSK